MKRIIIIIIILLLSIFLLYNKVDNKKKGSNNIKNHIIKSIDGVTYIDDILIVNKSFSLPKDYVPKNPKEKITNLNKGCPLCIEKHVYDAFLEMKKDAEKEGLNLWIQSGFRPYNYQEYLYNKYVLSDGVENADKYSSRPGYSEHQSGLAFDLNTVNDDFLNTEECTFVHKNAYKYGFIIRFPEGEEEYTGYKYEPWHLRYVGKKLSKKLYKDGNYISLERYFNITSKYE